MSVNKSPRRIAIWGSVVVVMLALGWWAFRNGDKAPSTALETEEVTRGELRETVSATGALQAVQTVSVGTQVSGTIDKIYVDFNAKVKQGDLLALIEPSVLDAQLDSARASLSQATARHNDAVSALEEGQSLLAKAYISDRDIRTLKVNVVTTKAQLDSAKADFERARRNRQFAEIRSPIDGVVIERAVDRGQTVAASLQTPTLFTIAEDLTNMQVVASVDESQIGSIKEGQSASFSVSTFPGKKFGATVKQIRLKPTVTQNVVTYAVVLDAKNNTGELFPGMTATVDFVLKEFADALRVPSPALRVQRLPEELMDAETLKRAKEMQARMSQRNNGAEGTARAAGGPNGGPPGNFTPEQVQAFRQRMTGGGGGAGRSGFGSVWVMNAEGKARRVPVRVLASDLTFTAIEPIQGELKVGDKVVTKAPQVEAQANAPRSLFGAPPRGGRQR